MSRDFAPSNPFRRSVQSRGDTDNKDTGKTDAVHVVSFQDSTPQPAGKGGTLSAEGDHRSSLSDSGS
jgi:hypothetical protein